MSAVALVAALSAVAAFADDALPEEAASAQAPGSPEPQVPAPPEEDEELPSEPSLWEVPNRLQAPPIASARPLEAGKDLLARAQLREGRLVVDQRPTTLDPELQRKLTRILRDYQTPYAAVVAIEPSTGRVLAMAEHAEADPAMRGLTTKAVFPAASIFKVVTASALLEQGVGPEDVECSFGGKRRLSPKMLADTERDSRCHSLSRALALSANSIFAKLTHKHLTPARLQKVAESFRFNNVIDFPVPTDVSLASFPEEPFAFASTGAGFGDVFLSPLHAATIAGTIANGGEWVGPVLFEDQVKPGQGARVLAAEKAELLEGMLEETVTTGTARRIFRQRGFRVPGAVGKTGNLADRRPFRDYSWFVGYAPRDNPKIAVAAVIVNEMKWRIRGTWLGREALRLGLEEQARATPPKVDVARAAR